MTGHPLKAFWRWLIHDFFGIFKELRWSYLPPLMVYLAAGVSGLTGIVQAFFVKKELDLSAEFLVSLGFWATIPFMIKMPFGHLVDLFWKWKSLFVYFGATLMGASLAIMAGLTGHWPCMAVLPANVWFIIATLIAPFGFMMQDVVADAMTVEAVPRFDEQGRELPDAELQRRNVTVQTLGRIAIVGGGAMVAGAGGWLTSIISYSAIYQIALVIPVISIGGVIFGDCMMARRRRVLRKANVPEDEIRRQIDSGGEGARPNYHILIGGATFIAVTGILGWLKTLGRILFAEEVIFLSSMGILLYLISRLLAELPSAKRREIWAIAIIIFVFRAMPAFGPGFSWWEIDVLGFDELFFGTLGQVGSLVAIGGMFALRGWMARRPVPYLIVFLCAYYTVMILPFIGMYYGLHLWTEAHFGFGARTIALVDTTTSEPLSQVAMIPMLAWIAKEAPRNQKATYFAIMASFTNLALQGTNLSTKYINRIFTIERGQYGELGQLMIVVALIGLVVPILTVFILNPLTRKTESVPAAS